MKMNGQVRICAFQLAFTLCILKECFTSDCPLFKFGTNCNNACVCDQSKSLSCDKHTGECLCKNGWTGVRCTCIAGTECDKNSFCDANSCFCNDGVLNKPSNCSDEVFVLYSCSFETEIETCSIYNHGEMKWRKHSNGTPSDDTGPYSAKDGSFYVYTEASGGSTGDEGVMEISLANLNLTTTACFQFYFHMRGSEMGDLDVIVEDKSGSDIARWTMSGPVDSGWNQGFVSLLVQAEMINLTGRRGSGFRSDIALDDFKIYQGHCNCPPFTFGTNCNKTCVCDQSKSLLCDKDTGECLCKNGWTGVKCSCREKTKCDENSFCEGSNCFCNDGVLNKPTNCSDEVLVLYSCSFETDIETCSIYNHGEMKWRKHSDGTPSDDTGPYSAKEGTFYAYTEATGLSTGDEGVMEISLANLNLTTNACFQFYFHMRGSDMGDLDVIVEDRSGSEIARWSKSGHVDTGWNQGFVFLPVNAEMINITGRRGSDYESDIALDDFKIYKEHCNCPPFTFGAQCDKSCACDQSKSISCDTDTGECLCKNGWTGIKCTCGEKTECDEHSFCDANNCFCNDGVFIKPTNCSDEDFVLYSCSFETYIKACSIDFQGEMKWRKHSRGTPSDDTGPYSAKDGKFYVYTEASGVSAGDEGVMEISLANFNLTTYACFQFYFHMRGREMGNLDVIIHDKSGSEISRWSQSGHVDSEWKRGFVSFPANAEMIKVTGRRGSDFTSDIALDDLKIFQGHCSCESWTFGLVCEKVCDCRRGSSSSCDSKSGTCMCKQGWSGKTCNCRISLDNCHSAYSYCHGYRCLCKDGHYSNGVNCSGLIDVTYFCGFDMFDSLKRCNVELQQVQWEIIESWRVAYR
ncbi:MAM and LDL-receptor class A domain-containing protein 1-like isoform X5 [Crassostrea angulata]|uniref:MAM and LDL-receptor class A domain-containing protein 1-like isoform X5 n=1 Tax=Magallana angulata TaxID=2784310 RepID=UPI0022B0BA1F|nr:MAM and LDL-receptor class A domain-containing protein 1-like isoform X5 [Crassostrea angulata]